MGMFLNPTKGIFVCLGLVSIIGVWAEERCKGLRPPRHGALTCIRLANDRQYCGISCHARRDIPADSRSLLPESGVFFYDGSSGAEWAPHSLIVNCTGWRNVSESDTPSQPSYFDGRCGSPSTLGAIAGAFFQTVNGSVYGEKCRRSRDCFVDAVDVLCGWPSPLRRRHLAFRRLRGREREMDDGVLVDVTSTTDSGGGDHPRLLMEDVIEHQSQHVVLELTGRKKGQTLGEKTNDDFEQKMTPMISEQQAQRRDENPPTSDPTGTSGGTSGEAQRRLSELADRIVDIYHAGYDTVSGLFPKRPRELGNAVNAFFNHSDQAIFCPEGYVPDDVQHLCVPCYEGFFYDVDTTSCQQCDYGFYQDIEAQMDCLPCPAGQSTVMKGSRRVADCRELCANGHFSTSGFFPCIQCPRDTFQPLVGQAHCFKCPDGGRTLGRGTANEEHCIDV